MPPQLNLPNSGDPTSQAPTLGDAAAEPQVSTSDGSALQEGVDDSQAQAPSDEEVFSAIEQRMQSVSPDEQNSVKQALAKLPELPQVLKVIMGPPLVNFGGEQLAKYFTIIQQKMQGAQPNSQGQTGNVPQGAPAPAAPQAKATPAPALNTPPQGPM